MREMGISDWRDWSSWGSELEKGLPQARSSTADPEVVVRRGSGRTAWGTEVRLSCREWCRGRRSSARSEPRRAAFSGVHLGGSLLLVRPHEGSLAQFTCARILLLC